MGTPPSPYTAVLVVEVDDQPERPPSHWLSGDEGVLKGGLSASRDHGAQLQSGEVLDVELVILRGTKQKPGERGFGFDAEKPKARLFFTPGGNGKRHPETPR